MAWLVNWFALPANGLASVFLVAFFSATLLPMGSEPAVFAYVSLNPEHFWLAVLVATVGNTLGGIVDYGLGRGAKYAMNGHQGTRYLGWLERFGSKALLLAWLPVVGDPLCALAGWLRLPFWSSVAYMALGKALRYTVMTAGLMRIPDSWWQPLGRLLTGG